MTNILVAVGLLIFEIVLFFWCRFVKRRFLNLNVILKSLGWLNWIYWLMFSSIIWQHHAFIFPYDFISGTRQVDSACMIIAFIFSVLLCYQSPLTVYMRKRR